MVPFNSHSSDGAAVLTSATDTRWQAENPPCPCSPPTRKQQQQQHRQHDDPVTAMATSKSTMTSSSTEASPTSVTRFVPQHDEDAERRGPARMQVDADDDDHNNSKDGNDDKNEHEHEHKRPRKRNVTFHPYVRVKPFQVTKHSSSSSKSSAAAALWYSKKELRQLKEDATITLILMLSNQLHRDTDEHSRRGLECQVPELSLRRRRIRRAARWAVFDEQDRQWSACFDDEDAIADAYMREAITSQVTAQHVGHLDAVAAGTANASL
eukprot:CAMPEP_0119567314 /NCGR_PEP_ID=MMETSP1352-20130426/35554_1 /TAXON_ID=265584 /ORGANISM="Stauroneis constricta, Strain CCMP1120" /LENGTH=266 /DNA_ID=CAMNT_0007616557 /DNA_START=274 /DNA_END=1074 /DNA_ORIENTATION=+